MNFARSGAVSEVLVTDGQMVEAGERLATLDMSRLERKQTALDEALEAAKADLQRLNPAGPELTVNGMRLELRRLRTEIDRMDAQLAQMPAAAPAPLMERLRTTEQQIAAMDQAERRQSIQAASQRIAELQGQLEDVRLELQEGVLTAPYAGVIGQRYVNEGVSVSPAVPIVRLSEQATLQAWIGLPEELAEELELDEEFELVVGGDIVFAISLAKLPEVDRSSRIRTVVFEFDALAGVTPGQVARLDLQTQKSLSGVWLPLGALAREVRGLWSVLVVEGSPGRQTVARRFVEIAHVQRNQALVQGGLNDGELVVVDGANRIVPGQSVTPLPAESPASKSPALKSPAASRLQRRHDRPRRGHDQRSAVSQPAIACGDPGRHRGGRPGCFSGFTADGGSGPFQTRGHCHDRLSRAAAEQMESLVTSKLERHLRDIPEIKEILSSSQVGVSTLVLEPARRDHGCGSGLVSGARSPGRRVGGPSPGVVAADV